HLENSRALARLHRGALKTDAPCRRDGPSSVSRALLATIDAVQRSLTSPSSPASLSLQLSGYGVCIRAEPPKGATTTLGLPNASAVTLAPASTARCLMLDASPFPCARDDAALNTQFVMVKAVRPASSVQLLLKKRRAEADSTTRARATRGMVTLHRINVPEAARGFDLLVQLVPDRAIDLLQVAKRLL
ncbi:MAG: hypothetical protein PV344_01550, partial [Anaplasma sp.]|nr:hypothetical protein [Anaplasma sp.]